MDIGLEQVFVYVVFLQQALVLLDVQHRAVGEFLVAAGNRKAVLVADRRAGDLLEPVGFGTVEGTGTGRGILLDDAGELTGRQRHCAGGNGLDRHLAVIFDRGLSAACPACGDDNDTVGTACTVDCGRGAGLEDVDGLDLLEVDVADVGIDHAVDDQQRALSGFERAGTTEQKLEGGVGVAAVGVVDGQAGHLALEHSGSGGEGAFVEVVRLQAGHGAGDFLLGRLAVADDDGLFQHRGRRGLQLDGKSALAGGREGVVVVAKVGHGDGLAGGDAERERAVGIGEGVFSVS